MWREDSEVEEDYARVKRRERGSGKENKQAERETMASYCEIETEYVR